MQILSAEQIRAWDEFTMQHEPIASAGLMERAAGACLSWIQENGYADKTFAIFCGKGNNGGDGLALARLLSAKGVEVSVSILEFGHLGTADFQLNLARLHQTPVPIRFIQTEENFHPPAANEILVDAIYGSGLNRPLEGVTAKLVEFLNASGHEIIAIDIPTGMFTDKSSTGNAVIRATHTLSFQCYKLAFLMPENGSAVGKLHILGIGLDPAFLEHAPSPFQLADKALAVSLYRPRQPFAHKGNFGHALLLAGSFGKMGAAVLCSKACLRTGAGLLTVGIPGCGVAILQTSIPEAMVTAGENETIHTGLPDKLEKYSAIGAGPGLGTAAETRNVVASLLRECKQPLVLDADALNIIADDPSLLKLLPEHTVLTPHPKEFSRLFGDTKNDFETVSLLINKAVTHKAVIVWKGHHTAIALPDGSCFFNTTGNAGMAKGGSGDALTGIITAFLAQGYKTAEAAILGVYIHGLAGDHAAAYFSQPAMLASDLIECIGDAFLTLE